MAKSDILSTVATRIAAATSSTPPDELATLKILGTKLGLDTSNIVTQANTASNTASGKDLYDVTLLNQALDDYLGHHTITITAPENVQKGDLLYCNDLGSVFINAPDDISVSAFTDSESGSGITNIANIASGNALVEENAFVGGENNQTYGYFTLSNGNKLVLLGYTLATMYKYFIMSSDMKRIITKGTININDGFGGTTANIRCIKETATNQFKFIFTGTNDGTTSSNPSYLYYLTCTYNTTTHSFTQTVARTQLFYVGGDRPLSLLRAPNPDDNTLLFKYYTGTNYRIVNVNVVTNTVFQYTAVNSVNDIVSVASFNNTDGIKRLLVRLSNSTCVLLYLESDTSQTLPANLQTEIVSSSGNIFFDIGNNGMILSTSATQRLRLIVFNNGATTISVKILLPDSSESANILFLTHFIKKGNEYEFPNKLTMVWDGVEEPTIKDVKKLSSVVVTHPTNREIKPNNKIARFYGVNTSGTSSFNLVFFTATASCYYYSNSAVLGVFEETAVKGTSVKLKLVENTIKNYSGASQIPNAFGYGVNSDNYTKNLVDIKHYMGSTQYTEGIYESYPFADTAAQVSVSSILVNRNKEIMYYGSSGSNTLTLSISTLRNKGGMYYGATTSIKGHIKTTQPIVISGRECTLVVKGDI